MTTDDRIKEVIEKLQDQLGMDFFVEDSEQITELLTALVSETEERVRERCVRIAETIRENDDQEVINKIHNAEEPEAIAYALRQQEKEKL